MAPGDSTSPGDQKHRPEGDCGEVGGSPAGLVPAQQQDAVSPADSFFPKKTVQRCNQAGELPIGENGAVDIREKGRIIVLFQTICKKRCQAVI